MNLRNEESSVCYWCLLFSLPTKCLINPEHPDYKRIAINDVEPLRYDPRMFATQSGHRRRKKFQE